MSFLRTWLIVLKILLVRNLLICIGHTMQEKRFGHFHQFLRTLKLQKGKRVSLYMFMSYFALLGHTHTQEHAPAYFSKPSCIYTNFNLLPKSNTTHTWTFTHCLYIDIYIYLALSSLFLSSRIDHFSRYIWWTQLKTRS